MTEPLQHDRCDLRQVQRIAALLDRDPATIGEGDPLPPGWHFALFTPIDRQSAIRPDGYIASNAARLAELADMEVMLGGRRTEYRHALPIGAALTRRSSTVDIRRKEGRSGPLVFVTRRQEIFLAGDATPAIVEHEDFIYRTAALPTAQPSVDAPLVPPIPDGGIIEDFTPTETMLFRYSALSFNAHRIHFDLPYAIDVSGFPGLVVNGGLVALSLLDLFARRICEPVGTVTTRSGRPLFCGRHGTLQAREDSNGWTLTAFNERGEASMYMSIA